MIDTENKVPALRFPEFGGEWKEDKLLNNVSLISGQHLNPDDYNKETQGIPYFSGPSDFIDDLLSVKKWAIEGKKAYKGDILITVKGSGVGAMVILQLPQVVIGRQLMAIRENNSNNIFIYQYLLTKQEYLQSLGMGNMIPGISREDILNTKLSFPSLSEQQKIASFLTAVDAKIELLTKKKTLLEQYKKGVMQQIFSKQIRFKDDNGEDYPDWEVKHLGQIARITTGSSNREDSNLDGEFTFFDRSQDIRSSNRYLFDAEVIIVPGEGQEFTPKYFKGKFDLHQRTYAIMDFDNIDGKFLFYSIFFNSNHLLSHAVGSTVKSLRLPMFKIMPISLPTIPEQQKIANLLIALDQRIDAINKSLELVKTYKKGLLQQLFV